MRPTLVMTIGAAKVTKTAHAAKAPGKLRRVPCVSRSERPVPNSLPSVAQTCEPENSDCHDKRCCDTRRHRGRWMGVERWVQIATGFRTFRAETPQFRRQTGGSGRCPDFNIRQEIKPRQHNHSNWHGVSPGKSSKTGPDTKPPVRSGLHPNHLLPVRALLPTFQATVKSRSPASAQREAKPPLIFRSTSSSASAAGP